MLTSTTSKGRAPDYTLFDRLRAVLFAVDTVAVGRAKGLISINRADRATATADELRPCRKNAVDRNQGGPAALVLEWLIGGIAMKKPLAEFVGTLALVLFGCGAATIAGMGAGATSIDVLGIALAFGLAIVAMAYGIGPVSGCHVNPAVSFGMLLAGRMSLADFVAYSIAQVLGALAGAGVLYLILSGKAGGWNGSLGQNGWGAGYLGEYGMVSALVFETVATLLFLVCILGVTQKGAPVQLAGLAIGLTLTAIHIVGINVTGVSVNPARSLGPAIVGYGANPHALGQVWLFIVAPLIGAGIAGVLFKGAVLTPEAAKPVFPSEVTEDLPRPAIETSSG
jgi:aquaporin Z